LYNLKTIRGSYLCFEVDIFVQIFNFYLVTQSIHLIIQFLHAMLIGSGLNNTTDTLRTHNSCLPPLSTLNFCHCSLEKNSKVDKAEKFGQELATMQVIRHLWARSNTAGDGGQFGNSRVRILKLLRSPGIDSKESIPPAYVAWRAGTTTLLILGS
jgi:hypothetical protein